MLAAALAAGCGDGSSEQRRATPPEQSTSPGRAQLFAPGSVWNRRLPDDAPRDPRGEELTTTLVNDIKRQQRRKSGPWIMTTDSSTPVLTVPRSQPRVRVALDVRQEYGASLREAFRSVPIPADARPAEGPDGQLTVVQPSTDSLWEFWKLRREGGRWRAAWGGAMRGVSRSPGHFEPGAWPGARSYWGASATSLPLIAGLIRIRELEQGRIDHALAIAIPNAHASAVAWPAQRGDGTLRDPDAIPEGAHFRLDPALDIESLDLPPAVRTIARAVQRYGMIVRDKTLDSTGFYAEDPTPTGSNPYPRLFGGLSPSELLASFPWERLQVMRMRLRPA